MDNKVDASAPNKLGRQKLESQLCQVTLADKWYIKSAEKKALYKEIFTLSKPILLANKNKMVAKGQQCGVIMDIDETLLDNSMYQYTNEKHCTSFKAATWSNFVNSETSTALPGASDITHYIHTIGCKVNLVSGRTIDTLKATKENLEKENIYFDQILLSNKISETDKNPRFIAIAQGVAPSKFGAQVIIAYYGDNIEDFPYNSQNTYQTSKYNHKNFDDFGSQYFVLPNPIYGSWLKLNN